MNETSTLTNLDRIGAEIQRHAEELAPESGVAASDLVHLLMEIVDLEDQHRLGNVHGVRKRMKGMIQDRARAQTLPGGS